MILLNVKEVKDFFLENGFVYSLRKPRREGNDTASEGNWRQPKTLKKIADVHVQGIIENVQSPEQLVNFVAYSGLMKVELLKSVEESKLECSRRWLELARKLSGPDLNLYKIRKRDGEFKEWFESWERHIKETKI